MIISKNRFFVKFIHATVDTNWGFYLIIRTFLRFTIVKQYFSRLSAVRNWTASHNCFSLTQEKALFQIVSVRQFYIYIYGWVRGKYLCRWAQECSRCPPEWKQLLTGHNEPGTLLAINNPLRTINGNALHQMDENNGSVSETRFHG